MFITSTWSNAFTHVIPLILGPYDNLTEIASQTAIQSQYQADSFLSRFLF